MEKMDPSHFTDSFRTEAVSCLEKYLPRIVRCLELLGDDQIWWRPNTASNAVGNIVLHLCGNVRQWIDSGLGGSKDIRRRDVEFAERSQIPATKLALQLQSTIMQACRIVREIPDEKLLANHTIQGQSVSGIGAILRVCEHFAYHSGQIIFVTKLKLGKDLEFTHLPPYKEND